LGVEAALDTRRQGAGAVRVEREVLDRLDLGGVAGGASSAMPASSRALSRILALALEIAAGAPPDGLVL